ncbi:flagellar biosynthesis protein FlhB [Helicobacter cetorum]|uniref:flagellar biosynthesis protein FlhB n=1 Tax=Helicobacter cetorum TaxID=138563 RepID=UPI000CF12515|nr:flagellar biosynthesis protein FlhB [Helicobacter cetorum]
MAEEEKTELPSAKKIQKAREEGNVPKSMEVVGFLGLLAGLLSIFIFFMWWVDGFSEMYRQILKDFSLEFSQEDAYKLFYQIAKDAFLLLLPLLVILVVVAFLANTLQFGLLFAPKTIQPKFSKINPINGIKNLFSLKKLIDGSLITLKVFLAFFLGFFIFSLFLGELNHTALLNLNSQLLWFRNKALLLITSLLFLFFVMAFVDLIIKRRQYTNSLKMTKQEVKDEYKQQEGNPEIKAKIRQMMMKNATNKMMQEIPKANVVVTNPTHYAIALKFDEEHPVPIVVAKGTDYLAIRIKGIAREHGIDIIENKKLARELYRDVKLNATIPEELFEAVAIVFAQVAKLEEERKKQRIFKSF